MTRDSVIKNGDIFGRLTVIEANCSYSASSRPRRQSECLCECGQITLVNNDYLKCGDTKSCGCLVKSANGHTKNGWTRAYRCWSSMKQRCNDTNATNYSDYGGRGIKICTRWRDFTKFLADMGEPDSDLSLDRIDTNGDYTPENCRWATAKEQCNNRRSNRLLIFKGETKTLQMWAEYFGISQYTLHNRLEAGWTVEKSLTQPIRTNKSGYRGVTWSKKVNKWRSRIRVNGKYICLGYFLDVVEAAKAYDKAAIKYFDKSASLNFPGDVTL